MELLLSPFWFGKDISEPADNFYSLHIRDIRLFERIGDLPSFIQKGKDYFIIISYDLSGEYLELEIKRSGFPSVIMLEIERPALISTELKPYKLSFKGPSTNDRDFMDNVKKIKDLIAEGTIYQVNLTNRFDFSQSGDARSLFFDFYRRQPVPYAFYFNDGDLFIISGSMELFLEKEGRVIRSKPIKGTATSQEDLLKSEKDRAENLMITDMSRNDLGRIAIEGSVQVTELFRITKYETLFQMHSTVEALTEKGFNDIIYATFPPASVTGAPKRKAVEVINLLEPHPRSYYCGAAGIIRKNGDFTLSVLIRTAIGRGEELSYYAGCGIVWDSDPEKELSELYLKVKAFQEL